MPKGGLRTDKDGTTNHLFKPKWNNKKTTAIRIPEVFKSVLLGIARHLDRTQISTIDDQEIIDDVVNCFRYKELWSKYKSRIIELRQEKRELIHEVNNLSKPNKQKNQQNKYQIAVECFEEFVDNQNLNMEELSKSRKGTKKHQLYEINQWLLKQSELTKKLTD
jgi:hypothetical protein